MHSNSFTSLNQRLAQLSPEKRALLEAQLLKKAENKSQIPRRSRHSPCSLSFAQQRLWFLAQLDPDSAVYNIPIALQFTEALDISALQQALSAVVARHEALRTTFDVIAGEPVQIIGDPRDVELTIIDLKLETDLARSLTRSAQRPFDLRQDLMLKATLFRLANGIQVLLLLIHHIASDGWSNSILIREINTYYKAFATGVSVTLPELPIQYADFAQWQRQWFSGEVLDAQLRYWKQCLSGELPILELPSIAQTCSQTSIGKRYSISLSLPLTLALNRLAQQQEATLFMVLLAAFKTLLYRYTDQEDILIGTPIANRKWVETESLIGFFINTLVLRTSLSGDPTFRELLDRVRAVALSAYDHQDLPFEKLVEELQLDRDLNQSPLVQVMFVLQNALTSTETIANSTQIETYTETAKFDLVLSVQESSQGLTISWTYNTAMFDQEMIRRMTQHYETLLNSIAADSNQSIATLPLLMPSEKQQLLVAWNQTQTDYPRNACIHQVFETQVEKAPDAIAIIHADQQFTYRDLNQQANQLAHYLKTLGVQPNQPIAVHLTRSPRLIIALLAILKAGGAYLPLDPTHPLDRLSFMLEDAQAAILLHDSETVFPSSHCQGINLDTIAPTLTKQSTLNPSCTNTALDLAYVLYTSGSTGKPKGVIVPHRAVIRLVINTNYIDLRSSDVVAQVSNCSFDAATFEIWGALLNGAKLSIISKDILLSPYEFAAELQSIQVLFLTTALFHQLAQHVPDAFQSLRYLLVGGETIDSHSVKQIINHGRPQHFLHVYGPTENTTFSSWYRIEQTASMLPIGRPIANTQIFLLNRALQSVPIGVPGEIYLGGDGLALGYLNRSDEQRFVSFTIEGVPTSLYRTGDRARYRADGNLEFLGRFDHQVKLRGFRIELGEVEAALRQHINVQDAIVLMRHNEIKGHFLHAYVTSTQSVSSTTLRQFLQNILPEYMIPSAFSILEAFPLTPNGKVDRTAPQQIDITDLNQETTIDHLPANELEQQLLDIWQQVTGVESLSIYDNFFEIGGHSLLAVRLHAEIEQQCGRKLPLIAIFQAPTVRQMAQWLQSPTFTTEQKQPLFWCSQHPSEVVALSNHLGTDQPLVYLDAGMLEIFDPANHVRDRATQCLAELKALQPQGPYFLGGFCFGGMVVFEMALQLQAQGEEVALLTLVETWLWSQIQVQQPLQTPPSLYRRVFRSLAHHYCELSALKPADRLKYLSRQIQRFSSRVAIQLYGETIEQQAKREWVARAHQSVRAYVPARSYSDQICFYFSRVLDDSSTLLAQSGWERFVPGTVDVRFFAGDHFSLIKEMDVQILAEGLKSDLSSIARLTRT